jgi:hypothetical protein
VGHYAGENEGEVALEGRADQHRNQARIG